VTDALDHVSEVGIALLLFVVGLELNFAKVRDVGKVEVLAGLGQVLFMALGGFAFCRALGFTAMESGFLAAARRGNVHGVVLRRAGRPCPPSPGSSARKFRPRRETSGAFQVGEYGKGRWRFGGRSDTCPA